MTSARRAVAAMSVLSGLVACQWIGGFHEPVGADRPEGGPPPTDPCTHARPPAPPEAGAAEADAGASTWMAMTSITFPLIGAAGAPIGFDLDDACTCAPDLHDGGPPCVNPAEPRRCDGPLGIDNTFAHGLDPQPSVRDLGSATNAAIAAGGPTVLVYVSGYNGQPDDDSVIVGVVPAVARSSDDTWQVESGGVIPEGTSVRPIVGLGSGYVSGGRLVSASRAMAMPFAGSVVTAKEGTFSARIEPVVVAGATVFQLVDGVAAVRAALGDFVDVLGRAGTPEGPALCTSSGWPSIKTTLCASLDTTTLSFDDFRGKSCDAFSLTWGFSARPARIVTTAAAPAPADAACAAIATPEELCSAGR